MSEEFLDISISGLAATQKKLFDFSNKLGAKVTLNGLSLGARFMLRRVKSAAPVKTGRLKKAIVVRTSKRNQLRKNGKIGVYLTIKTGKRTDLSTAYYATWVEEGHKSGKRSSRASNRSDGRSKVKGLFFVRNSFSSSRVTSVRLIIRKIETDGRSLIRALSR